VAAQQWTHNVVRYLISEVLKHPAALPCSAIARESRSIAINRGATPLERSKNTIVTAAGIVPVNTECMHVAT
jgi:hypothetical protein